MRKVQTSDWVKGANISILLLLFTYGCQSSTLSRQAGERSGDNHTGNPDSGSFLIQAPSFNVTGSLTTEARPNSTIYLFVTPNTSFESSLYAVENYAAITEQPIMDESYFTFENLPPGDYVAMLPRD